VGLHIAEDSTSLRRFNLTRLLDGNFFNIFKFLFFSFPGIYMDKALQAYGSQQTLGGRIDFISM